MSAGQDHFSLNEAVKFETPITNAFIDVMRQWAGQLKRHNNMAIGMIRQLKDVTQDEGGRNVSKRSIQDEGDRNVSKRSRDDDEGQSQKYRVEGGENWLKPQACPSKCNGQRDEILDRPCSSTKGQVSASKCSHHQSAYITPQCLVQSLVDFPNFSATLLQLTKCKNLSPSAVLFVASVHQQLFVCNGKQITLKPNITVCREYLGHKGCQNRVACRNLHICPNFITGTCDDKNCFIGHSWHTNHNGSLLESLFLKQIPVPKLHDLLQSSAVAAASQDSINVCLQYNRDGCKERHCRALHVCLSFVIGLTRCGNESCQLNHDILSRGCKYLLKVHGFSINETPRDLTVALLAANPCLIEENNKIKVAKKDEDNIEEYERTLWSHYLQGTVPIQEICYDSVKSICKYEDSRCRRLHATQHFHWQVSEQGKRWLNLRSAHVMCLERAFCDVSKDGVDLPRLDPATGDFLVSGLLFLMGRDTWHADFKAMNLTSLTVTKKLLIRRLCTEAVQGQVIRSASFTWSFLDKNQKWVKYGNIDTAVESNLVSSVTSDDIEKSYLENPSTTILFNNSKFKYALDFKTMVQTNQTTKVSREIRRRPAFYLEDPESAEEKKAVEFPATWDAMQPEETMHLVPVSPSSNEYKTVIKLLRPDFNSSHVRQIIRLQNPFLWRALQNKIREMTTIYGDAAQVDVRLLFHGTGHDVVSNICAENFDWRLHGSNLGHALGHGIYFSTDAAHSYNFCRPNNTGTKHMFLARVAVGTVTVGNQSMVRPPINPATNLPFDSSVDNISDFKVVVKYDKQEYCPEYILLLT